MNVLPSFISGLTIGAPRAFGRLTIHPLFHSQTPPFHYWTLDDAVETGSLSITEISSEGQVPMLLLRNSDDRPVLILDGEELVGAKQNRVINLTVLAPAKADLALPVSCVEQGRWSYNSREFKSSKRAMYADMRARNVADISESLAHNGTRTSDQVEIWRDLAAKRRRMGADAPTEAMSDLYDSFQGRLEEAIEALRASQGEAGAIVAVDNSVRGLDVFDRPATYAKLFPKILGSYAIDALDPGADAADTDQSAPQFLLDVLGREAVVTPYPAPGLGADLRIDAVSVVGAALEVDNKIVHLCGFMRSAQDKSEGLAGAQAGFANNRRHARG